MNYTDQQKNAYHDAAHAVALCVQGRSFVSVSLSPAGGEDVVLANGEKAKALARLERIPGEQINRSTAIPEVLMNLSGPAATKKMIPERSFDSIYRDNGREDESNAKYYLKGFFGDDSGLNTLQAQASEFVDEYWKTIIDVGDKLLLKGVLTCAEVSSICGYPHPE